MFQSHQRLTDSLGTSQVNNRCNTKSGYNPCFVATWKVSYSTLALLQLIKEHDTADVILCLFVYNEILFDLLPFPSAGSTHYLTIVPSSSVTCKSEDCKVTGMAKLIRHKVCSQVAAGMKQDERCKPQGLLTYKR